MVDSTSDPFGEILAVKFSARGKVFDGDPLEQALLEACDGEFSLGKIQTRFKEEFEVSGEDFTEAFQRLWSLRLLFLD